MANEVDTDLVIPGLGRKEEFDERSRDFPIMELVSARAPRSHRWRCVKHLNQKQSSACVGFSMAHELIAQPKERTGITSYYAQNIYRSAKKLDAWPGENYDGTSVLAGAKVLKNRGFVAGYRWAFGLEDLVMAVSWKGPAVIGIPWHQGMFTPDRVGYIHPTGKVVGGHAILVTGVNVLTRRFRLHNSWGGTWGLKGDCYVHWADMRKLLAEGGDAVIFSGRS